MSFMDSPLKCFQPLSACLVSPVEVDGEEVLGGDGGPAGQRRRLLLLLVTLDARGGDERRRRVEEGRVRARRAHQTPQPRLAAKEAKVMYPTS